MTVKTETKIVTTIFRDSYKGAETQIHTFSPAVTAMWADVMESFGWQIIKQEKIEVPKK
jgi:hypothetical protein